MKVICGKEILFKECFGLFNKPYLIDFIKNHRKLLDEQLTIVIHLILDLDRNVYIPYDCLSGVEQLALQNPLKVKTVNYSDDCLFISCC